jgi:hypothetical protein
MPKHYGSRRLLKFAALVAALAFLAAVASLFWGGSSFSSDRVALTLEAQDRATSGDEITYTVRVRNDTGVALSELKFRFFWPEDTVVLRDGVPVAPEGGSEGWEVDRLAAGEEYTRELKGFIIGERGAAKSAKVNLIFKAGTLRSDFEKEASVVTTIADLPVTLTLVVPPTTVSGSTLQYLLDVRNETEESLSDLRLELKYPDGFAPSATSPRADEGSGIWNIASLDAGSGKRFTVTGVLTGNPQEVKTVTAVLQRKLNGEYVDYVRTDESTSLGRPLLSTVLSVNDSREYVSFAGDVLRYEVSYRNDSQYTFVGATLAVKLEGDMYDTSRIRVEDGFYDDATRTVTYDSSGESDLAQLSPGSRGTVVFTIPLKAGLEGSGGAKSFFVKATSRLSTPNIPSGLDSAEAEATDSLITRISSQPTLAQSLLFDNGAGSGPIPPKVGEETHYTVRWSLTNPGNDVRNTVVSATLAPGVSYEGSALATSGNAPQYDASSRRVTWSVGTLPFGTGNGTMKREGSFMVSLRPSENQKGTAPALLTGTTFVGTDSFTGQTLQATLRDLTTNNAEGHKDEGLVVP